ncbi:M48 family metalloprotease [Novosphingobium sp.]|uniref:M48 family metalloprotease n=1 Tax=Novosphingobium sp. TaxID=1874826 RepID=UPI0033429862
MAGAYRAMTRMMLPGLTGGLVLVPATARAAGFDAEHAAARYLAMLSPAARARSDAYFDGTLWLNVLSALVTLLICWIIARSRVLVRVRDALRRQGWRPWVVMIVVAMTFLAGLALLELPWSIYVDYWRERRFGQMNMGFGGWLGEQAVEAVILLVVGGLVLTVINAVMRGFPRLWWLVGAGAVAVITALSVLIMPVFFMPLFNAYTDLPAGPLRTRIEAMAAANHIPVDHIVVYNASRQNDRISANVSGLGPTVQISLTDTLVKTADVAEVAAVVGHEMGHYVLNHVWRAIVLGALLSALQFWLILRAAPAVLALGGRRSGLRGIDDPAAVPVLFALFTLLSLLCLPLSNTLVRSAENAADAFGLDTAREPDGFALAAMQLASYRKISPPAWQEALFFDHPSGRTRVLRAMHWKQDHVPHATEVEPPPLPDPALPAH